VSVRGDLVTEIYGRIVCQRWMCVCERERERGSDTAVHSLWKYCRFQCFTEKAFLSIII